MKSDRHRHVRARGEHVGARALVDAQLRVGHLEVGEGPQPERRAVDQLRVVEAQQQARDLAGERDHEQRRDRRRPRDRRGRRARDALAALEVLVVEVEADERLADADPQEDAREDHRGEQRFGGAVGFGAQVVRVERQREQRDRLRDDVPELVGRARAHAGA